MNRREFLLGFAASGAFAAQRHTSSPFTVTFRQQPQWASALPYAEPGLDEFPGEKVAMEIEAAFRKSIATGSLPLDKNCQGVSPAAREFKSIAPDVSAAVFGTDRDVEGGWKRWHASLGMVRSARFFALPDDLVRYQISAENKGSLEYRIGLWRQVWADGRITRFEPVQETITSAAKPWFRDITGSTLAGEPSFAQQLAYGVPYWRGRLDSAVGIDLYGENGISAADIDGDGEDEIYVCQTGGLPNRLYKLDDKGRYRDISKAAGLDILDNTACALFVDLRNSGCQDLVLVRATHPLLLLNDGKGKFTPVPNAFRFATAPQGSFTGVSAADYDRDGRLDLYFCCYVFYQSEAQYRYPVPYHDARNGPPNFLFRNRLDQNPGYFEDVTVSSGINHNNNRFSFAGVWCDYNRDGWPDLYVTNDFGSKNLYRNTEGHFRDVAEEAGVVDLGPGMSAAWLDYDGDGKPDLLVSNMWSAAGQRIVRDPAFGPVKQDPALAEAYRHHVKGNSLYHNEGDGKFTYTGRDQGIEIVPWSWSCDGADFDNDGVPELYVACGMLTNNSASDLMSYFYRQVVSKSPPKYMPAPAYENGWNAINQLVRQDFSWAGPEPNVFFARRAGRYYDFSAVSGLDRPEDSRSFAFTDIDGDGNLDVVLKSRLGPQVRVFQNACGVSRKALVISLRGTKSNHDAIGARVEVDGQVKWVIAGSAYLSQHTKRLHFGLGDRERAEKVRIEWPSGNIQTLPALSAGNSYEVTEGSEEIKSRPLAARKELPADIAFATDNEARLHDTWMWEPVPLPEKRSGPALLVLHAGQSLPQLPVRMESLDLRQANPDLVAAYWLFRRYLFDYRADLETPFWMLIDAQGRLAKIYAKTPDGVTVEKDFAALNGQTPNPRGMPFEGLIISAPARDYYKMGGALLQAGYAEQALPYIEETLNRSPDNARALLALGRIHLQAKRLEPARGALRRAVELNPELAEAWNELGGVESSAGNYGEALLDYQKALALVPTSAYALLNAAQTQEKLGNAIEAEHLYGRALELEPRNGDAANGLGLLLAKQGKTAEARKLFELAITVKRDDSSAINNLGVLFMNIGQPNDAVAAFEYGIKVAPDDTLLYMNLARVWVGLGDQEKARYALRRLLARKPDDALGQRALRALE